MSACGRVTSGCAWPSNPTCGMPACSPTTAAPEWNRPASFPSSATPCGTAHGDRSERARRPTTTRTLRRSAMTTLETAPDTRTADPLVERLFGAVLATMDLHAVYLGDR